MMDKRDVIIMLKGQNLLDSLSEYDNYLRDQIKYNDDLSDIEINLIVKLRERLLEIMKDNYIDLDELIF